MKNNYLCVRKSNNIFSKIKNYIKLIFNKKIKEEKLDYEEKIEQKVSFIDEIKEKTDLEGAKK